MTRPDPILGFEEGSDLSSDPVKIGDAGPVFFAAGCGSKRDISDAALLH